MRRTSVVRNSVLTVSVAIFLLSVALCRAADQPPQVGELFPSLKFPTPKASQELSYLGLGTKVGPSFKLGQVKARVVVLEVFSMYCPYCQAEAPSINGLFQITTERGLDTQVKLMGIGAANTPFEVDLFRKKYDVKFPLLPDKDLVLHEALGKVRTPYFIAVKLDPSGSQQVIYSKVGSIGSPEEFLNRIVLDAGIQ
jgi:peroxiredoxin